MRRSHYHIIIDYRLNSDKCTDKVVIKLIFVQKKKSNYSVLRFMFIQLNKILET